MQKACSLYLLLIICYAQKTNAQVYDSAGAQHDSLTIIKQLVKKQLLQQLKQTASYKKIQQTKEDGFLKDSLVVDTLGKLVMAQMQQIKNTSVNTGKTVIGDAGQTTRQLLQHQFARVMQTAQIKDLFSQFTGSLKQPVVQFQGGIISINGQSAPSLLNNGTVFINSNLVNSNWSVLGLPVSLQMMRQDFTGPEYYSRNSFSFGFDREAYLRSLREKIKLNIQAKDLVPDYSAALKQLKQGALQRLQSSLDSINASYKGALTDQLQQVGDLQNIFTGDISGLQDKLSSPAFLQGIENKQNLLGQLQNQLSQGGAIDKAAYDSLQQSLQAVEGVNKIINKIRAFKEEAQKSGLLEKLQQAEQFKSNELQQLLQDPDKLKTLAKDQLDLNGLQKFFLNMNQLRVGVNTVNLSPLTVYQYTTTGINAEFVNNKNYLFVMAGKYKAFSNLYDYQLAGSLFSADNTVMGVRAGRGNLQGSYSHLSLFTYKQQNSHYGDNLVSVVPGKTMVTSFSNQLKLNENNYLNVEISKSSHKYDNQKSIVDTLLQGSSLSDQMLRSDNFMQQLAFSVQWNGEIKDSQLSYDIHATSTGKGYNNPGSIFLSRGMTELGGGLKKSVLKNQLQFSVRGNYHEYGYGDDNTKLCNYNFSFQGKWKLQKGQYIALRYQPYQSLRLQDDKKNTTGGTNRLSLDMNIHRRIGKMNYQNTISLSALKNNYQFDSVPVNNVSVLMSSMQTITINKKSYYLNIQYNKGKSPSVLVVFNTQLNCDAGIIYSIGKAIMASTALNYNSTQGWFRQVGLKQSISGQIGQRFVAGLYADLLRNVREYRPNNMSNLRLDWSFQYLLK